MKLLTVKINLKFSQLHIKISKSLCFQKGNRKSKTMQNIATLAIKNISKLNFYPNNTFKEKLKKKMFSHSK